MSGEVDTPSEGKRPRLGTLRVKVAAIAGALATLLVFVEVYERGRDWLTDDTAPELLTAGIDNQGALEATASPSGATCDDAFASTHAEPLAVDLAIEDLDGCYRQVVASARPGETFTLGLRYQNGSAELQREVVLRVNLPPGFTLVPNSTEFKNSNTDNAYALAQSNNLAGGGVIIGDHAPGGATYLRFRIVTPFEGDLECGLTEFRTVGVVRPADMNEHYNTAILSVVRSC